MTIIVRKTIEEEKEIAVPSFWKEPLDLLPEYIAVLDEHTAVKLTIIGGITTIKMGHPDELMAIIREAHFEYNPCTEYEFMHTYNRAHDSLRLKPTEVLKNSTSV